MSHSSRYVAIVASINQQAQRRYELPREPEDCDMHAFLRWLLDVLPDQYQRHQTRVELHTEDWP